MLFPFLALSSLLLLRALQGTTAAGMEEGEPGSTLGVFIHSSIFFSIKYRAFSTLCRVLGLLRHALSAFSVFTDA